MAEDKNNRSAPPAQTGFIFKLLGFLLLLVIGYWAYYSYRQGRVANPADPDEQKKFAQQAKDDFQNAKEWSTEQFDALQKRFKGPPPVTAKDIVNEVKLAQDDVQNASTSTPTPAVPAPPPASAPPVQTNVQRARELFKQANEAYAQTDPSEPADKVQKYLRIAAPLYEQVLDQLDKARTAGVPEAKTEALETSAAKRLYDCRKRMRIEH